MRPPDGLTPGQRLAAKAAEAAEVRTWQTHPDVVALQVERTRTLVDQTHVATTMPEEWMRIADVIVGQRVCQPGATIRWQQMAREGRCALVFECDDDLLDIDPPTARRGPFSRDRRSAPT
jgi:hypothetical protein